MTNKLEKLSASFTYNMGSVIKNLGFQTETDWSNTLYNRDLIKATSSEWSKVFISLMELRATKKGSEKRALTSACKRVLYQSDISTKSYKEATEKYRIVRGELELSRGQLREIKTYILESVQTWKF